MAGTIASEDVVLGFDGPACWGWAEIGVGSAVVETLLEGREPFVNEFNEASVVFLAVLVEGEGESAPVDGVELFERPLVLGAVAFCECVAALELA